MTVLTDRPAGAGAITPRDSISADLFVRLVARIAREQNIPIDHAERIMDQALAFLRVCAANPGARLTPSPQVDIGWHAFILYTAEYAGFCYAVAGRFIHHRPEDTPGERGPGAERLAATVEAMRAAGLPVDEDLWTCAGECGEGLCSQCYQGCADDPKTEG
ncbi:hypothetical protein HNP84_007856 [Thermocatellispora tengchongensis]|uniref:Uncharacterized protein n=1 Tax=Thermocatellispora tengchongensis TaxID=1073253 RepID=A0A840PJL2_9ACTN|nr:hypothetical protein [Thermocatellispora tengchongensis]MBB5138103.1 hypothetical protein [Thermocatellispora tengchongensis]